jgi:hypothetical protein
MNNMNNLNFQSNSNIIKVIENFEGGIQKKKAKLIFLILLFILLIIMV